MLSCDIRNEVVSMTNMFSIIFFLTFKLKIVGSIRSIYLLIRKCLRVVSRFVSHICGAPNLSSTSISFRALMTLLGNFEEKCGYLKVIFIDLDNILVRSNYFLRENVINFSNYF